MKVLILNSDSPNNRGDRAILAGLIELIQAVRPDSEITALSQFPQRDSEWFRIKFLPFSPYSTSPLALIRLMIAAKKSDLVMFGGGELLKDYTNRLSLYYWLLKLTAIRLANKNIIGAFQGIGPTKSEKSKQLIVRTVDLCKVFIARDKESVEKLGHWGAETTLISSYDPAVFVSSFAADVSTNPELEQYGMGFVGLGFRRWFHYQPGGFLPTRFRKPRPQSEQELRYIEACADIADKIFIRYQKHVVFFPMHTHPSEGDVEFAKQVIAKMKHPQVAKVVEKDNLSPDDFLALVARSEWFIGSRLHSTILATVAQVPAMVVYYVDKGRLFFEQLGLEEFSYPIKRMQEDEFPALLTRDLVKFQDDAMFISKEQENAVEKMRTQLLIDINEAFQEIGL